MPLNASNRAFKFRVALLLLLAFGSSFLISSFVFRRREGTGNEKIAIIDPLAQPDSENGFTATCLETFESAGYEVDVWSGQEVTVDRLKNIPEGCAAIVLRVHSTVYHGQVWFFTGERYDSTKHVLEQLADDVHRARTDEGSEYLFAVGADFVLRFMEGRLNNTLVILMGCDGLASQNLARAFLAVGASAYVSWDGPVSLPHTDEATTALIEGLVLEGLCLEDAIEYSLRSVGPEDTYGSSLCYLPEEGEKFLLHIKGENP